MRLCASTHTLAHSTDHCTSRGEGGNARRVRTDLPAALRQRGKANAAARALLLTRLSVRATVAAKHKPFDLGFVDEARLV
jgi:hypothetical protein